MSEIMQMIADGRPGGGTTAVLTLSRCLQERGRQIILVTQLNSYLWREAKKAGFLTYGFEFRNRRHIIALARQIKLLLAKIRPSLVHVHGGRAALPLLATFHKCPIIYTVHGFHFLHKLPIIYRLAYLAEALCIARADCTVLVSDADRDAAAKRKLLGLACQHRVVKNAVGLELIESEKQFDIGFMGRLHFQKNPLFLVDILEAMRPSKPSLCVIGGGDLGGPLEMRLTEKGLRSQVIITGESDRATALKFLSECRVMVHPSRWEGHSIALIEAMLLGIPAVVSDVSGNNEIVISGRTGFLVPAFDPAMYADYLQQLLTNVPMRRDMGAAARSEARDNYSVDRMVEAYLDLYQEHMTPRTAESLA